MKLESKKSIVTIVLSLLLAVIMLFGLAGVRNNLSASAEEADYKTNVSISTNKTFVRPGDTFELTVSFSTNRLDNFDWSAISVTVAPITTDASGKMVVDQTVIPYIEPVIDEYGDVNIIDAYYGPVVVDNLHRSSNQGLLFTQAYSRRCPATRVVWSKIALTISEDLPSDIKKIDWSVRPSSLNGTQFYDRDSSDFSNDDAGTSSFVVQGCTVILTEEHMTNITISANKEFISLGEAVEVTVAFATNRPSNYIWSVISCTLAPLTSLNGSGLVDTTLLQYIQPVNGISGGVIDEIDSNFEFGISVVDNLHKATNPGILYSNTYSSNRMIATNVYWVTIAITVSEDLPADVSQINLGMQMSDYNVVEYTDKTTNEYEDDIGGTGAFIAQGCTLLISR